MKLRFDPLLQLSRNQVTPMEDSYFVFIDEEGHDLPIGVFFSADYRMVEEGNCPPGYVLRLYTTPRQAFGFYGSYAIEGLEGMEAVEELFEGTREDVGNRLIYGFRADALQTWERSTRCTTGEFSIEPKNRGAFSYFGFIPNNFDPEYEKHPRLISLGRIYHEGGRKYSISLRGRGSLTIGEGLSLKEARAIARSFADRDTFVEALATANLGILLEYIRNKSRSECTA